MKLEDWILKTRDELGPILYKIRLTLNKTRVKIKKTLRKINKYIKEDYGIDIALTFKKIFNSKAFHIILAVILVPSLTILYSGSLMVLAIVYPEFFAIYLGFTIVALLYILLRDKLEDKYQII